MSKHGVTRNCRLLCPECNELQQVKSVHDDQITLACNHTREQIIRHEPGRISLEQMNTEIGKDMFPVSYDHEATRQRSWNENHK